jgi:gliding motility-associated-like protein
LKYLLKYLSFKILFVIILFLGNDAFASHIMGGEITWACQGNGTYIFKMKVYRDCNGIPMQFPVNIRVHNHPSVTGIPMTMISQIDISPQCDGAGPTINCGMGSVVSPVAGAVEEFTFQSNPITLSGTPPPQGWVFTYDGCCRNNAILNLNTPGSFGITIRSIMYAYNGQNANPCYDSSPEFKERPATIICGGTPFTYNHNAFDTDLDSLVYSFAAPLDYLNGSPFSAAVPLTWSAGYSQAVPLPSPIQNPANVPASLNSNTGEIAFQSFTFGSFISVVSVKSYRCGYLVSEIFREIQIIILNCGLNNPPNVTAPFINPVTMLQTSYTDTVAVGDIVNFTVTATDNEFLPTGWPQTISLTASGGMFGAGYTDPNSGCPYPPCATLTPAPPTSSANSLSVNFQWQTTCDHIPYDNLCYSLKNLHTFVLIFKDNYCPAPSYKAITVTIVIKAKPVVGPPDLRCLAVQPNGDVLLNWLAPTDTANTFDSYLIYTSTNQNGPYTLVDSIFNINTLSYTHIGAGANNQSIYYYIRTRSGCNGAVLSPPSDTLQTMFISATATGSNINVSWNPISSPLPQTASGINELSSQSFPNPFMNIYNGQAFNYTDQFQTCTAAINYVVQMEDASGCTSVSNIFYGNFQNSVAPSPILLDSVSVNLTAQNAVLGWQPSSDNDVIGYVIYQFIGGNFTAIDTVFGINNTTYENIASNADSLSETYAIGALDNCNNSSGAGAGSSSIFLQVTTQSCLGFNTLNWTDYQGWAAGIQVYRIFCSVDGGAYNLVGSVSGTTNSYIHVNINSSSTYCYIVQAIGNNFALSSSSNKVCVQSNALVAPIFLKLRYVTVDLNQTIRIEGVFDIGSDVKLLMILRRPTGTISFDTLGSMNLDFTSGRAWYFDNYAVTSSQSYEYKIIQINNCLLASAESNIGRSILLEGFPTLGFKNFVKWNPYFYWNSGVEQYELYRMESDYSNIQSVHIESDSTLLNFSEDVSSLNFPGFEYCYRVMATETIGNLPDFYDTSYSNILCLTQSPTVYIPNAFSPDGQINTMFGPAGIFAKVLKDYKFEIYNRWGELLFSTEDYKQWWDGTYKGEPCQGGIYVYRLIMNFQSDYEIHERGSVTLLR